MSQVQEQVPVLRFQVPVPVPVPMSQVQEQVPVLQFQVPVQVPSTTTLHPAKGARLLLGTIHLKSCKII